MATSSLQRRALWSAVALLSIAPAGCTRIDNALASVPIFAFLRESPFFDPYEHPLPAPPGSVPFESPNGGEHLGALEGTDPALRAFAASPDGVSPLRGDDPAALALGKVMYDRHCMVCHGTQGRGDGPIIGPGKFPLAPTLVAGNALTLPDGYLYGIIRAGRGLMPAYGARLTHTERWAVVAYVKQLQGEAGVLQVPPTTEQQTTPGATQPDTTPAPVTTGQ